MSTIPLLSICIPTFNRVSLLEQLLVALLPQAEMHQVEVCISDNNSSDGTAEFLNEIAGAFACLRFVVNSQNIGLDRNMLAVIAMGTGQYIYPLGDDDFLPTGSLHEILLEIEKGGDVLILNGWHTSPSLERKWPHLNAQLAGRSFMQPDEAFFAVWDKMPFGSFLATRGCFTEKFAHRFIGTSHAYAGAVWDALADLYEQNNTCEIRCLERPLVLLRGGQKTWSHNTALIMLYEIPYWFSLVMEKAAYSKIIPEIRDRFLSNQLKIAFLIQLRALGQLNRHTVGMLGKECSPEQFRKLKLVIMLPVGLAQIIVNHSGKFRAVVKKALRK